MDAEPEVRIQLPPAASLRTFGPVAEGACFENVMMGSPRCGRNLALSSAWACRPAALSLGLCGSLTAPRGKRIFRVEEPLVDQQLDKFAELTRSEFWRDKMWTKLGMVAILAALLASTADLGYARAADGRATEGDTTGNKGPEVGGGRGPSGTALGGGDRSIHTKPSMNETSPGRSGGGAGGSSAPATSGSTGAIGSGGSAPTNPR